MVKLEITMIILGLIAAIIYGIRELLKRFGSRRVWKTAAERLGFSRRGRGRYEELSMKGTRRGKSVRVMGKKDSQVVKGSRYGHSEVTYYTEVWAELESHWTAHISITPRQEKLSNLGDAGHLGSPSFDEGFVISGDIDPETRAKVGSTEVCDVLERLDFVFEDFEIVDGCIKAAAEGRLTDDISAQKIVANTPDFGAVEADAPQEQEARW